MVEKTLPDAAVREPHRGPLHRLPAAGYSCHSLRAPESGGRVGRLGRSLVTLAVKPEPVRGAEVARHGPKNPCTFGDSGPVTPKRPQCHTFGPGWPAGPFVPWRRGIHGPTPAPAVGQRDRRVLYGRGFFVKPGRVRPARAWTRCATPSTVSSAPPASSASRRCSAAQSVGNCVAPRRPHPHRPHRLVRRRRAGPVGVRWRPPPGRDRGAAPALGLHESAHQPGTLQASRRRRAVPVAPGQHPPPLRKEQWRDLNGRGSYVRRSPRSTSHAETGRWSSFRGAAGSGHLDSPGGNASATLECVPVAATMCAGSVLVFGPYTVHRSLPNCSDPTAAYLHQRVRLPRREFARLSRGQAPGEHCATTARPSAARGQSQLRAGQCFAHFVELVLSLWASTMLSRRFCSPFFVLMPWVTLESV